MKLTSHGATEEVEGASEAEVGEVVEEGEDKMDRRLGGLRNKAMLML